MPSALLDKKRYRYCWWSAANACKHKTGREETSWAAVTHEERYRPYSGVLINCAELEST